MLSREAWPCLSETEKNKFNFCFCERHCFASANGTAVPSETEKKEFLRKLTSEIITLHDGSKGSVWSGLDEANQLRERFGDDFDGEYLYNLLDRYHNAQVKNGRFIYTGPYNSKGKK